MNSLNAYDIIESSDELWERYTDFLNRVYPQDESPSVAYIQLMNPTVNAYILLLAKGSL